MADDEELITGAEFARQLGVNRSNVTRYVRNGKLVPAQVTSHGFKRVTLYRASDVARIKVLMDDRAKGS